MLTIKGNKGKSNAKAKHLHFDSGTSAYDAHAALGGGVLSQMVDDLGENLAEEGFRTAMSRAEQGPSTVCLVTWDGEKWIGLPDPPETDDAETPAE